MPGKDKHLVPADAKRDSLEKMRDDVDEAIERLKTAIVDTSFELLTPTVMKSEWAHRLDRVTGIPDEIRDNEEALAHWKTLQDIAKSNYDQAIEQVNAIRSRRDDMYEQQEKLAEALERLAEAQKKDAFHDNMRSLARSAGHIETNNYTLEAEERNREIALLIHTADALIEIKKDDAV